MPVYIRLLKGLTERRPQTANLDDLHEINAKLTAAELGAPVPGAVAAVAREVGMWAVPNMAVPDNGDVPFVPPEDAGRTFEQHGVSHTITTFGGSNPFFGGSEMALHAFRSHDRQLLATLEKICEAIIVRDARTDNPKPTRTLSNRIKMFDKVNEGGVMVHPLSAIMTHATAMLALPPA